MTWTDVAIGGGIFAGIMVAVALLHDDPKNPAEDIPKNQPDSVTLAYPAAWAPFGNASISGSTKNFTLTNTAGSSNFASAAAIFNDLIGAPLDNSVQYNLILRVKGLNGFKKLGITAVPTLDTPNNVDFFDFAKMIDLSDGLDHDLAFALPKDKNGLAQVALHFGQNFGSTTLGNPVGSSVQVSNAYIVKSGVSIPAELINSALTAAPNSANASSNTGNLIVTPNTPSASALSYKPVFASENIMDVSPLSATQELISAANMATSVQTAQTLLQDAAIKDHSAIIVPAQ